MATLYQTSAGGRPSSASAQLPFVTRSGLSAFCARFSLSPEQRTLVLSTRAAFTTNGAQTDGRAAGIQLAGREVSAIASLEEQTIAA